MARARAERKLTARGVCEPAAERAVELSHKETGRRLCGGFPVTWRNASKRAVAADFRQGEGLRKTADQGV
jgi:hypothetical protein